MILFSVHFLVCRLNSEVTVIGRNKPTVDLFLDSIKFKGLISRIHAHIIQDVDKETGDTFYEIFDTSLNGTYVNNVKISGSIKLNDGDEITFGHIKGAVLQPGAYAPQKITEFKFKVSKWHYMI